MKEALQSIVYYNVDNGEIKKENRSLPVLEEAAQLTKKESNIVGLYPDFTYQILEGFGCAMTETSCYLLSKMDAATRAEVLKCWFGPEGMDARFIRIPIDSCDYSLSEYQAVADPIADPELNTFTIDRDRKYILPVMEEVLKLCGKEVSVLLSPWSPPVQWKTAPELTQNQASIYGSLGMEIDRTKPNRKFGGRLKREFYAPWAKYLVKFVQAYLAEGIPVTMLSVQNEASAATCWDSCLWSSEQEKTFLRDYLYPEMKKAGLADKIGLYIWDHNKERMIEHIVEMMDEDLSGMIQGFAFHWYTGDHFDALSMLHERYPDKILLHSESCGLHIPGKTVPFDIPDDQQGEVPKQFAESLKGNPNAVDFADAVAYAHDIIGDLNHGMQRWIDWNLIVDRTGGPRHVPGGFAAPIVYEEDGTYSRTISFEYLLEISKAVKPGCVRIGSSVYSKEVEATAVRNPDGSFGVLLLNQEDLDLTIYIRVNGYIIEAVLPAHTMNTVIL